MESEVCRLCVVMSSVFAASAYNALSSFSSSLYSLFHRSFSPLRSVVVVLLVLTCDFLGYALLPVCVYLVGWLRRVSGVWRSVRSHVTCLSVLVVAVCGCCCKHGVGRAAVVCACVVV